MKGIKLKDPKTSKSMKKVIKLLKSGKEIPFTFNGTTGVLTTKNPYK